jgi:antirestriction protein ArdC
MSTGKNYRGINVWILAMSGYNSNLWGTFKSWKKAGGCVNKGEKSTRIIFYKPIIKNVDGEDTIVSFTHRVFSVFNREQVNISDEDLKKYEEEKNLDYSAKPTGKLMDYFNDVDSPTLTVGSPSYNPRTDTIKLPSGFLTEEAAISVAAHEIVHSTGSANRLNRDGVAKFDRFGSHQYSKEELIAELGSMFICSELGVQTESTVENSEAYIQSWVKKLSDHPTMIFNAASEAAKATDYIMNIINNTNKGQIAA